MRNQGDDGKWEYHQGMKAPFDVGRELLTKAARLHLQYRYDASEPWEKIASSDDAGQWRDRCIATLRGEFGMDDIEAYMEHIAQAKATKQQADKHETNEK